eukprot:2013006-Pleurochrysis_carterae.AAC.1
MKRVEGEENTGLVEGREVQGMCGGRCLCAREEARVMRRRACSDRRACSLRAATWGMSSRRSRRSAAMWRQR